MQESRDKTKGSPRPGRTSDSADPTDIARRSRRAVVNNIPNSPCSSCGRRRLIYLDRIEHSRVLRNSPRAAGRRAAVKSQHSGFIVDRTNVGEAASAARYAIPAVEFVTVTQRSASKSVPAERACNAGGRRRTETS